MYHVSQQRVVQIIQQNSQIPIDHEFLLTCEVALFHLREKRKDISGAISLN